MSDRRCSCERPDPVMQADRRFYCYTCSFQVPAVLCPDCQKIVPIDTLRQQVASLTEERDRLKAETAEEHRLRRLASAEIAERDEQIERLTKDRDFVQDLLQRAGEKMAGLHDQLIEAEAKISRLQAHAREKLSDIEKQWRSEAGTDNNDPYDPAAAYNAGIERCADDLAALLSEKLGD